MKLTPSESEIQISIIEYLSLISVQKKFIFFSIPNEAFAVGKGKATLSGPEFGRIENLKKMGLTPGVSDIEIVKDGKAYFMEIKKPGGNQSDAQKLFMQNAYNVGAEYAVVRSFEQMEITLETWGII